MLTARVQYALVLLSALKNSEAGRPVKVKSVAKSSNLDEKFLQQVARFLRIKGIIRSVRGPGGGCMAAKELGELTLLEVMDAVESAKKLKQAVPEESGALLASNAHSAIMGKLSEIPALS